MKLRDSERWYRHPNPGCRAPAYIAVFERWAEMRRADFLKSVGCRRFAFVPANAISMLADEYAGHNSEMAWRITDWFFVP